MRLALALLLPCLATGQVKTFDVATVKPAGRGPVGLKRVSGGRITLANYTLRGLIHEAWRLDDYQIVGGPGWLDSDRFDVAAVVSGQPTPGEMDAMLQALLTERFSLRLQHESKEGPVYELVVGHNGPKLEDPKGGEQAFVAFGRNGSVEQAAISLWVRGTAASMPLFAARLAQILKRPVLDRTGLTGSYDFKFDYAADENQLDAAPSILTAIQQIGLRLNATKGPVETLVVDHAEKPSEN